MTSTHVWENLTPVACALDQVRFTSADVLLPIACNYNPNATTDDGSCDFEICVGCIDETACNYDATATVPNDLCVYPPEGINCDGTCIDSNDNGTCDFEEIAGCTIVGACNYNPDVDVDDGSCEWCECFLSTPYTLTVESAPATVIPDATTYRFYVNFDNVNDQISSVFGNTDFPLEVNVLRERSTQP